MKIISKRKDYYDGVGRGAFDSDLIYKRVIRSEIIETNEIRNHPLGKVLRRDQFITQEMMRSMEDCTLRVRPFFRFLILHFCGVQYPMFTYGTVDTYEKLDEEVGLRRPETIDLITTCGDFMDLLHRGSRGDKPAFMLPWLKSPRYGWQPTQEKVAAQMNEFFVLHGKPSALNAHYNSPVVVEMRHGMHDLEHRIDDLMSIHGFAKVFPPQQAWQEISMWMGTHYHRGEREMLEISDDVRAQQHGFDKMSFRKGPTKRK